MHTNACYVCMFLVHVYIFFVCFVLSMLLLLGACVLFQQTQAPSEDTRVGWDQLQRSHYMWCLAYLSYKQA